MLNVERKTSQDQPLVLVVDDEESICESLSSVLQDENFQTIIANNGQDALEKVKSFSPDMVFLDIWMPGWDGIETLEKIKQVAPQTQVVMISGHASISNALDAIKRGAIDLIEKPLNIESIMLAANTALERRARFAQEGEHAENQSVEGAASRVIPLNVHKGIHSTAMAGENLGQRTLKDSVILYGQCLHSGVKSGLVLEPLPKDSGIHFAQMGGSKTVPVFVDYVESTELATTIRSGAAVAATIEHLMAALHSYRISNLLIKCNGEVPVFDGSSKEFCDSIQSVGIEEQGGDWFEIAVDEPVEYTTDRGQSISLEPADCFTVTYELNYPAPVGQQIHTFVFDGPESFEQSIAPARTFGFMADAERLQKAGLAAGARLDNFVLIGNDGIVNTELRFPDELARHKVLDAIGDLFLIGRPLRCHVRAKMTGHSDNAAVLKQLAAKVFAE